MSDLIPERPDRAIARLLAGGLDDWRDTTATVTTPLSIERGRQCEQEADFAEQAETYLICREYALTPAQVDDMGPTARRLALDFLSSRTETPRRDPRRHLRRARWAIRHAIWQRRHRTKHA